MERIRSSGRVSSSVDTRFVTWAQLWQLWVTALSCQVESRAAEDEIGVWWRFLSGSTELSLWQDGLKHFGMSPIRAAVWVTKRVSKQQGSACGGRRNAPELTNKSCGRQLAVTAVMLTASRALKPKTLSVNPTLGLRGNVRKWFYFHKEHFFWMCALN